MTCVFRAVDVTPGMCRGRCAPKSLCQQMHICRPCRSRVSHAVRCSLSALSQWSWACGSATGKTRRKLDFISMARVTGPRAARLEQHVPLPKLPGCVLSDWHLDIFSETDDAAIDPQPDMVLTKGGNFSSCDGRSLRWCIKVTSVWLISPYLVGLAFSRSFL